MSEVRRVRRWAARTSGRLAVLRLHDLRFVFCSTLVSSLGDGIVGVALAFAVLDLTHSATDLGIVMAARTITIVGVVLIGGVVADRLSRRTVMMVADLVRFGGQVAIGVLLAIGQATVLEIVVSQMLVAAGNSFFEPASMGMIQATAGEHVQEANALKTISMSSTGLLGPALGGALVATIGSSYALMADGATYLLSALLLAQVSRSAHAAAARDTEAPTFLADLRDGYHEVSSRRWLWATIVNMALWWTAMQHHVPKDAISRVSSYDWAGTLAVAPIGYALVGPLASAVGVSAAIIACSAGALAVTASALLVRDIRMLPARPVLQPGPAAGEPA